MQSNSSCARANAIHSGQSIIILVFFAPYILLQFPAQIAVRKIGPRIFLSTVVLCWGIVMIVRQLIILRNASLLIILVLWFRAQLDRHDPLEATSRSFRSCKLSFSILFGVIVVFSMYVFLLIRIAKYGKQD